MKKSLLMPIIACLALLASTNTVSFITYPNRFEAVETKPNELKQLTDWYAEKSAGFDKKLFIQAVLADIAMIGSRQFNVNLETATRYFNEAPPSQCPLDCSRNVVQKLIDFNTYFSDIIRGVATKEGPALVKVRTTYLEFDTLIENMHIGEQSFKRFLLLINFLKAII